MTVGWVVLAAVLGGFVGALGAGALGRWGAQHPRLRRFVASEPAPAARAIDGNHLDLIRRDVLELSRALDRVLEEVSPLAGKIDQLAGAVRRLDPPSRAPARQAPPRDDPAGGPQSAFSPGPSPFVREEPAVAAAVPAGPPPNAINVEARDDRLVASSSYPPEAWLEPRGPASGNLWLNPAVALNENALRRLSTFFQWEAERPGARYETATPASIQWDEGRRTGTVLQRGAARPR